MTAVLEAQPAMKRIEQEGYPHTKIMIETEGGFYLVGNITKPKDLQPDQKVPAVMIIHGAAGEFTDPSDKSHSTYDPMNIIKHIQDALAEQGIISLVFASRGIGESEGAYNEQSLTDRLVDSEKSLEKFIQDANVDPKHLAVLGVSMGAHVASELAERSSIPLSGVALWEPAAYPVDAQNENIGTQDFTDALKDEKKNLSFSPAFEAIRKYKKKEGRIFLAYGAKDVQNRFPANGQEKNEDKTKSVLPQIVPLIYRSFVDNPSDWLELEPLGHELLATNPNREDLSQEKKEAFSKLYHQTADFIKR